MIRFLRTFEGLSMAWTLILVWLVVALFACVTGTVELDVSVEDGVGECSCPRGQVSFTCRVTGLVITMNATPFSSDPVTFSFSDVHPQTMTRPGFTVRLVEVTPDGSGNYTLTAELNGMATEDLTVTCTNGVESNQMTLCLIDDPPQQPMEDRSPELVIDNDTCIGSFFWNNSGMVQAYTVDVFPNLPGELCDEFGSLEATLECCGVEIVIDLCETSHTASLPGDAVSVNIAVAHNISVMEYISNAAPGTDSVGNVTITAETCDQRSEPLIIPFNFTRLLVLPEPAVGPGTGSPPSPITTTSGGTPATSTTSTTPVVTIPDPPDDFETSSQSGISIGATIGIVVSIVITSVLTVIGVIAIIVYWKKKPSANPEGEDRHFLTCYEGGEQTPPHSHLQEALNMEEPAEEKTQKLESVV